jgi:ketosteroid isomerase-like protein
MGLGLCVGVRAQMGLNTILDAERALGEAAAAKGQKAAFVEFLTDDSIIFRPEAINGKDFWTRQTEIPGANLTRTMTFADVAANGLLGYTTGNWQLKKKDREVDVVTNGNYVTIWERRNGTGFRAVIDISIRHDEPNGSAEHIDRKRAPEQNSNKYGWSPADTAMKFLRAGMTTGGLAGAYDEFADDDVLLLIDREPPIQGKKRVIKETKRFTSTKFPLKVAMYQAADMAYFWNQCHYANSEEGQEVGNCLQILKLRKNKWYIVLGVFARVASEKAPLLTEKPTKKRT